MALKEYASFVFTLAFLLAACFVAVFAGGPEFTGQFEPSLIANVDDFERVVLKSASLDRFKGHAIFPTGAHITAGQILNPQTQQYSLLAVLVEEEDEDTAPILYIDLNNDYNFSSDEKYVLTETKEKNPYLWETTVEIRLNEGTFKTCPIYIRYFKSIQSDNMGPEDRLLTQSTQVLARGQVDVRGKKVMVQYAYDFPSNKVDPQNGYLGADTDGDGLIDLSTLSPESTDANHETVVFRVGDLYVSTKKADVAKNQIVLRENEAKEYKRAELFTGKEFPEFTFTDFDGKKHKISDYRGKYVLLDIWGFWCGPCRKELPYIREANRRFGARNLIVLGLNTDEDFTVDSMKKALNENGMNWTHGQFTSVVDFLRLGLRVHSFPTTFLIAPDGKILSMSRTDRDEPDLRGKDLLESLEKILPKS